MWVGSHTNTAGQSDFAQPLAIPPLYDGAVQAGDATNTRRFRLGGTTINSRDMDMDRIDEMVTVGDTEIWEVTHAGGSPHNFHVHDVQFVVHTLDGVPPPPAMQGWKDTVYVPPDSTVRLLLRFSDYTDPEPPYRLRTVCGLERLCAPYFTVLGLQHVRVRT